MSYRLRQYWKSPGFTVAVLAALALGIGASTAIFSVVDAVLLRPLPFPNAERLLVIWEQNSTEKQSRLMVAPVNFLQWRTESRVLERLAAYRDLHVNLTGGPRGAIDAEELAAQQITADMLPLLGVQPAIGRWFRPQDSQAGSEATVLLSDPLWQRRFGRDRTIAGKSIRLDGKNYTVAGVMPAGFQVMDTAADIWLPLPIDPADARFLHSRVWIALGRLRAGATLAQARRELAGIGARMQAAEPHFNRGWLPSVYPLRDELVGSVEQPLLVMLGAVGLLLLIACVNVANLLLARGATRRREIAIRMAMGATRARIAAQLLSESVILALAGGAFGLLLAWFALMLFARLGPSSIPRLSAVHLDWRVFLFAIAVSMLTGLLCGILPAIQESGAHLHRTLMQYGRGRTVARSTRMVRNGLVIVEVALAVLVLIGAGLLLRSFARLRGADLGFRPAGLLTLRLPLSGHWNAAASSRIAFLQQVEERLAAVPGVRSVGAVDTLPLTDFGIGSSFAVEGRPVPEQRPIGLVRSVTPGYFRTMGLPLLEGREFSTSDSGDSPLVLIVSRGVARRFWPDGGAVGGRLMLDPGNRIAQIVGVSADVKPERIEGEDWLTLYSPYAQTAFRSMNLVLRTAVPPESLIATATAAIRDLDSEQPVSDARSMEAIVDRTVATPRFHAVLLAIFAQISFVLAVLGVYGVVSYDVSQRTGEIGVRLALGARPAQVLGMLLRQTALVGMVGIAAGLGAAWGLTRWMASMLYGVDPTDAYTFVAIPVVLGAVVLLAGYLPSRRAMALDPALALRHE